METKKRIQFWVITESEPSIHEDTEEGIGPYLLAAMAKREGCAVSVYQASQYGCDAQAIAAQIKAVEMPDILAFSVFSGGIRLLRKILDVAEPACPIMIGGPGATSDPAYVLSEIGYVVGSDVPLALVQSEGENAFAALLATPPVQWNMLSQCWRLDGGKILPGQFGALSDLDEKPLVDLSPSILRCSCERTMRDGSAPLQQRIRAVQTLQHCHVETRRGCFFKCEFCSEPQLTVKGVRRTSPERAIREIVHLFENFGVTFFNYVDNVAFDNETWWRTYAELLQQLPYHHLIKFGGYGTPKFFSRGKWFSDTLPLLYRAGLSFVTLGVQSGSPRILKGIIHRPPDDPKNALEVVRRLVPQGLNVKTDFIVGHPTETAEDLEMTRFWINRLYEAGAQVFVRRLGIIPKSGYDFRLRGGQYALPGLSGKSETIISNVLRYHDRKGSYLRTVAESCVLPNSFLIDRQRNTLFPKVQYGVDVLLSNAAKVSALPEPLRERYATLFDLIIKLKRAGRSRNP